MLRALAPCFAWAVVIGLFAACNSSSSSGPGAADAACTPIDATLSVSLTAGGTGACNTCIETRCGQEVSSCSMACACNDTAVQALQCIENLGASVSIASESACVAPLDNSTDTTLSDLGTCLLSKCETACGAPADASAPCDAVGVSVSTLLEAGTGGLCESCLQSSCSGSTGACAADCTCNAAAVSALECLANLGDATTLASASGCVGPLIAAGVNDLAVQNLGSCLVNSCASSCGAGADGGAEAAASDATTCDAASVPSVPDEGIDAGIDGSLICNDLAPAPGITFQESANGAPSPMGGTMVSGTYRMTSWVDYATMNGTGLGSSALAVIAVAPNCSGGQAGSISGVETDYEGESTFTLNFSTSGNHFNIHPACGQSEVWVADTFFTATPTQVLVHYYLVSGNDEVATFTLEQQDQ
jgi:hypothetical protein